MWEWDLDECGLVNLEWAQTLSDSLKKFEIPEAQTFSAILRMDYGPQIPTDLKNARSGLTNAFA